MLFQGLQANVVSHEIRERTGNRSVTGVEAYITLSSDQKRETHLLEPPFSKQACVVCKQASIPSATVSVSKMPPDMMSVNTCTQHRAETANVSANNDILRTGDFNNCTINLALPH